MRIDVDYPEFLDLEEGRPAVFSANGSHGVWAQPGTTYKHSKDCKSFYGETKNIKRCICCPYFALKHKTTHNLILTSENRLKVIVAGKLKILVILPPCSHLSS